MSTEPRKLILERIPEENGLTIQAYDRLRLEFADLIMDYEALLHSVRANVTNIFKGEQYNVKLHERFNEMEAKLKEVHSKRRARRVVQRAKILNLRAQIVELEFMRPARRG